MESVKSGIAFSSDLHADDRGELRVHNAVPFDVSRVFWITSDRTRGGHGHYRCRLMLCCVVGRVSVEIHTAEDVWNVELSSCAGEMDSLILDPSMWHKMFFSSPQSVLLCFASTAYDETDYFFEDPYVF